MRVKEESEEVVLKLNTQKTKITASHHFMANEEKVEVVTDFIFLGSKSLWMVTAVTKLRDNCTLEG